MSVLKSSSLSPLIAALLFCSYCETNAANVVIKADDNWAELPVAREIEANSILDFSFMNDAPAGKYGRVIPGPDGHLMYEKTGKRVRLTGNNLCFGANYLEKKEDADKLARYFQRIGYNTMRFHHTDVDLIKGNWNARNSDNIDTNMLDRFDYMFATMKNAGMYISIDLYTMRYFGASEIPGFDIKDRMQCDIKALLPVFPAAFDAWAKLVVKWMNHTNAYTGIAWKDDPALVSVDPLNEDSIASVWAGNGQIKELYNKKFGEWLTAKSKADASGPERDQLLAQFLTETKMASNTKINKFLRDLGIKAMLTGDNWWDHQAQAFTRSQLDFVDNHHYWDHPQGKTINQSKCLTTSLAYICPVMKSPSRIMSKPFMMTEYNFVMPNIYRAEAGALVGAYASLQDWDGLYRFAWSHNAKNITKQMPAERFDMATDPLAMLTERQILLMFGRGDVSAAKNKFVYAVNMKDACKNGVGDMWGKGLFPGRFTSYALISQIGSQVINSETDKIIGKYNAVVAETAPGEASLAGNTFVNLTNFPKIVSSDSEIVSDTGEIMLNNKKGYVKVVTPLTECITAPKGINLSGNCLAISGNDFFASISASAMDRKPLSSSQRILLFHLTNVFDTDMTFSDGSMKTVEKWGALPYLVRAGSVNVSLKNTNPNMKLFAVDFAGKRTREIAAEYKDGAYIFKAQTVTPGSPSTMIYELAAK